MYKKLIILFTILLLFSQNPSDTSAAEGYMTSSAQIRDNTNSNSLGYDYRANKLKVFFEKYNSPLSEYSYEFVYWADEYDIDWRLVPAISGVESTFGKRIPPGSFNAYGWANGNYRFSSWEDSIEHVTMTLRTKYKDRGAITMAQIARRYAPPSSTWLYKVNFFMDKIDSTPLTFDL